MSVNVVGTITSNVAKTPRRDLLLERQCLRCGPEYERRCHTPWSATTVMNGTLFPVGPVGHFPDWLAEVAQARRAVAHQRGRSANLRPSLAVWREELQQDAEDDSMLAGAKHVVIM